MGHAYTFKWSITWSLFFMDFLLCIFCMLEKLLFWVDYSSRWKKKTDGCLLSRSKAGPSDGAQNIISNGDWFQVNSQGDRVANTLILSSNQHAVEIRLSPLLKVLHLFVKVTFLGADIWKVWLVETFCCVTPKVLLELHDFLRVGRWGFQILLGSGIRA